MKYRMLLLLVLICAILVAAAGGTLAGYTGEAAFSFSIQPDIENHPLPQQLIEESSQPLIETPQQTEEADVAKSEETESAPETSAQASNGSEMITSQENE